MIEKKRISKKTVLRILETLLDILAFALSMQLLIKYTDPDPSVTAAVFAVFSCATVLRALGISKENKVDLIKYLLASVLYAAISVLSLTIGDKGDATIAAFIIFVSVRIIMRIAAIIKKRKIVPVILNSFLIAVWLVMIPVPFDPAISELRFVFAAMFYTIGTPALLLSRVTFLSFAHIRYDILLKVVRRSLAVEILTGLLILIVTFSFALVLLEPSIETYPDALWYCFAIVTTIGFGDITAVSDIGRILSVVLGIYGIIVVSLITSVIVNFYSEVSKEAESKPLAEKKTPSGEKQAGRSDAAADGTVPDDT